MKTVLLITKKGIYFSLLILSSLLFSCEKDKDPFAACRLDPTCEYFTCKVNGVRWEPQCKSEPLFGCTPWNVQYYKNIPALDMYIDNEKNNEYFTILTRNNKLNIGVNQLFIDENIQTRFSNLELESKCVRFRLDTLKSNSLNVSKIDSINFYLSGTFYFTGKNDCGDIATITEGEFNLPYRF